MGLAGEWGELGCLGRELRALASTLYGFSSERTRHRPLPARCGAAWRPPEISVTNSRADCALTQQMIGCIRMISILE